MNEEQKQICSTVYKCWSSLVDVNCEGQALTQTYKIHTQDTVYTQVMCLQKPELRFAERNYQKSFVHTSSQYTQYIPRKMEGLAASVLRQWQKLIDNLDNTDNTNNTDPWISGRKDRWISS